MRESTEKRSGNTLVFEQDGFLHTLDVASGRSQRININVTGDFPWAAARWVDAARGFIATAALSPTGKRALMEARGEVFTIPVEKGDARNLTRTAGAADRAPVWSPNGTQIAWFSDDGTGYVLKIENQDGTGQARTAIVDVGDPETLDPVIAGVDVVLNTVGPFTRLAEPVIAACLRARTAYVDLANELAAVQSLLGRDAEARRQGVALVTGAGFGVVATETLAPSPVHSGNRNDAAIPNGLPLNPRA